MRIAYHTAGDRSMASSRLRAWMIGDALERMGHEVYLPNQFWPATLPDVMVFQKVFHANAIAEMKEYRRRGVRIVWDCDDYIPNGPVGCADVVTVDTPAKLDLYPNAVVIPDALDIEDGDLWVKSGHAATLQSVVWFGNADNVYHAGAVAEACRELGLQLKIITQIDALKAGDTPPDARLIEWNPNTVDAHIARADVAACSYVLQGRWSEAWVKSKSANRLLKAWGLGMPVVGTPIPSYMAAGLGHWATTADEWVTALAMMQSAAVRAEDGERGLLIANNYRAEVVANKWLEVFERCTQPH